MDETCAYIDVSASVPAVVGDTDVCVRILAGDNNNDGRVSSLDRSKIKSLCTSPIPPVDASNANADCNTDGAFNSIDRAFEKKMSGNSVICP